MAETTSATENGNFRNRQCQFLLNLDERENTDKIDSLKTAIAEGIVCMVILNRIERAIEESAQTDSRFSLRCDDDTNRSQTQGSQELSDFQTAIATAVWRDLPFNNSSSENPDIDAIVKRSLSSYESIQEKYRELNFFVDAVISANVDVRGAREAVDLNKVVENCLQHVRTQLPTFPSAAPTFVDYKFASLSSADALRIAKRKLWNLCCAFATDVVACFNLMVNNCVLGSVQFAENSCRYFYWQQIAIFDRSTNTSVVTENFDESPDWLVQTTTTQVSTDFQGRLAQITHHVANCTVSLPTQTINPIPVKYQSVIAAVPGWLRDHLRLILRS